jgi:hypothetical protein
MNDAERDDLLRRLAESETARRRWKVLALLGTPVLSVLLAMMAAFGTSSYGMLRDAIRREKEVRDTVLVDVLGTISVADADTGLDQVIQTEEGTRVEGKDAAKMPHEPGP